MSKKDREYLKLKDLALVKGWHIPPDELYISTWIAYWKACEAYEINQDAGRPVIPHRTGR